MMHSVWLRLQFHRRSKRRSSWARDIAAFSTEWNPRDNLIPFATRTHKQDRFFFSSRLFFCVARLASTQLMPERINGRAHICVCACLRKMRTCLQLQRRINLLQGFYVLFLFLRFASTLTVANSSSPLLTYFLRQRQYLPIDLCPMLNAVGERVYDGHWPCNQQVAIARSQVTKSEAREKKNVIFVILWYISLL